jgi:hypothetical protein
MRQVQSIRTQTIIKNSVIQHLQSVFFFLEGGIPASNESITESLEVGDFLNLFILIERIDIFLILVILNQLFHLVSYVNAEEQLVL